MTLVEFLTARLDEGERDALAASPGPWTANAEHDEVMAVDGIHVADGFSLSGNQLRATVDHIVRHDPARVLRRVKAGRRLIERYERALRVGGQSVSGFINGQDDGYAQACLDAIEDAAEIHSDHPDYQEAWRV